MTNFSFTATATCDYCGNLLSSSTEECGACSKEDISQHFFREIAGSTVITVCSTNSHVWQKLESVVDDWWQYEWLGQRRTVYLLLTSSSWSDIHDIPSKQTALERKT
jgi:RNA polymerase subunit RPABC4/transcription elongation factor Spt4